MLPNPAFASRVKTTKAKALQMFAYAYPSVEFIGRDGLIDRAMMAREWKQFVEGMYRDGLVTQQQRKAWANPFAATARIGRSSPPSPRTSQLLRRAVVRAARLLQSRPESVESRAHTGAA